jgi:hypothetical protein
MLLPVDVKVHDTHFGGWSESKTDDIQGKLGKEDRKPIEALGEVGVEEIGVPWEYIMLNEDILPAEDSERRRVPELIAEDP